MCFLPSYIAKLCYKYLIIYNSTPYETVDRNTSKLEKSVSLMRKELVLHDDFSKFLFVFKKLSVNIFRKREQFKSQLTSYLKNECRDRTVHILL